MAQTPTNNIPNLEDLLTSTSDDKDRANVVEIYICPHIKKRVVAKQDDKHVGTIGTIGTIGTVSTVQSVAAVNVGWSVTDALTFLNKLNISSKVSFYDMFYQDLIYSYDMKTDGQKVVKRQTIADKLNGRYYILKVREDVLPAHRFPCTPVIQKEIVNRTIYRMNNRLSLTYETQDSSDTCVIYFTYNHSPNVDLRKIQYDLQKTLFTLLA